MTDAEFLRSVRRAVTHEDCERIEREVELSEGVADWINPHEFPHRFGESAH